MEYREFRAEGVGVSDDGVLEGLVTPFGKETVIGDLSRGGFREQIAAGAFRKTLEEGDPLLVYQHDLSKPLARKSAGNLDISEGEYQGQAGLVMRATPVDTSYGRDCRALVKAGVIKGMSFGFNVVKDRWTDDEGRESDKYTGTRREVLEVRLIEASPVTRPAYGDTAISARDESSALLEQRASSVSTDDRKSLAAKGHALPDGSYPIPDKEHLHSAAVLAASKHGDWQAAKALIRKRAKELGVDVNTLPGFGGEKNSAESLLDFAAQLLTAYNDLTADERAEVLTALTEHRDDPDGKEYKAIDEAVSSLAKSPPDVKGALSVLHANQAQRSAQEPESSTPDDEDDFALLAAFHEAEERSRELGFVEA